MEIEFHADSSEFAPKHVGKIYIQNNYFSTIFAEISSDVVNSVILSSTEELAVNFFQNFDTLKTGTASIHLASSEPTEFKNIMVSTISQFVRFLEKSKKKININKIFFLEICLIKTEYLQKLFSILDNEITFFIFSSVLLKNTLCTIEPYFKQLLDVEVHMLDTSGIFHLKANFINKSEKYTTLLRVLDCSLIQKIVIFVTGRNQAQFLSHRLENHYRENVPIFTLVNQNAREKLTIIDRFKQANKGILILNYPNTIGLSVGANYNVIINYDIPNSSLEYELRQTKLYSTCKTDKRGKFFINLCNESDIIEQNRIENIKNVLNIQFIELNVDQN